VLAQIGSSRVRMAHFFWRHTICLGDTVIDATCGHGKDSLEMCRLISDSASGKFGRFVGFDVQKSATDETFNRLSQSSFDMSRVLLFNEGHENMWKRSQEYPEWFGNVKLVSFNLGYLPGGNKAVHTKVDTTLEAVEGASRLIVPGGIISIVQYPHAEGQLESQALRSWYKSHLPPQDWIITNMMNPLEAEVQPSILFLIRRSSPPHVL